MENQITKIKTKIMQLIQDTIYRDCHSISVMQSYGINFSGIAGNIGSWKELTKEEVEKYAEEGIKHSLELHGKVIMYVCRDNREVDIEYSQNCDLADLSEEIAGIYYVDYDS